MRQQEKQLESQQPEQKGTERRAAVRYSSDLEGTCEVVQSEKDYPWFGDIQDISTTGMQLLISRRFERGSLLTVEVQTKDQKTVRKLLVRVARVKAKDYGQWLLGCAFVTKLRDPELKELI
jgi:hypothetical protein